MLFRFTKNAAEHMGIEPESAGNYVAENKYCEWFVDLATNDDNELYFLVTNAYSLFSIAFPAVKLKTISNLLGFLTQEMKDYFYERGYAGLFNQFIAPNLKEIKITKPNNRSVMSSMNNALKSQVSCSEWLSKTFPDRRERFLLNDSINQVPCKCANTGVNDYTFAKNFISSDLMKRPLSKETSAPQKKSPAKSIEKKKKPAFQFYAELCRIKPKIWRRFVISQNATMEDLAFALMAQFNMDGSHLYSFKIPLRSKIEKEAKKKGVPLKNLPELFGTIRNIEIVSSADEDMDTSDDDFMINKLHQMPPIRFYANEKKIRHFIGNENEELEFYYDFGDDWQFKIKCENKEPSGMLTGTAPFVLAGKGLGIIENCGGIGGLEDMKAAFKKKSGKEYESYCDWLGVDTVDFDTFDVDSVNKEMKKKIKSLKNMWEW